MPFRKFFAERGASHPVAYSLASLAAGMLACMTIAVIISVQASNRASNRALEQERAAREEARLAACLVISTMAYVYSEPTPPTLTGRQAAAAWTALGVRFGCPTIKGVGK